MTKTNPTGIRGSNGRYLECSSTMALQQSHSATIVAYKFYLREHLVDSVMESILTEFQIFLDENKLIQSMYDTLSFMNELIGIETQFFRLQPKMDFVRLLNSFYRRISDFQKNHSGPSTDEAAFNYLYSAIYSKICAIKRNANRKAVVDLSAYLTIINNDIKALDKLSDKVTINRHQEEYKQSLDEKIQLANNMISNEIQPEIDRIFYTVDNQINELIIENMEHQNSTKSDIEKQKKKKTSIEKQISTEIYFGTIKNYQFIVGCVWSGCSWSRCSN